MVASTDLRGFAGLSGLDDTALDVVAGNASECAFAAGRRIFDEGKPAAGCWLIRSGRVALETIVPGRGDTVVQTLGAGELLGWSWLVPPFRWHFSATAFDAVTAYRIDTESLRREAEADPELGYRLALGMLEVLLARLQSTRARLLDLYASPRGY
jgi:CRP-like cAMP-binding protein